MKIKIGRIKKHHILLSLGVTATALLPLGATMACGDSTEAPNADQAKVDVAKKLFTSEITKQTLTTSIDLALQPGLRSASEINSLVGIKAMPNVAATGATVTYTALAKAGLTQTINVTITAGLVTDKSISIVLTYASHTATDQEKVTTTKNLFTPGIKTQVLTASIDHALAAGNIANVSYINNLPGIIHMPVVSVSGVTVNYTALAVSGLTQTINVAIAAGAVTDTNINIVLTFQPHVQTGDEKITAAYAMFTPAIGDQFLTATIDSKLDHTAASISLATINDLAGITHIPDTSSTGATVVYTAAAPVGLVQVVTATISATGGIAKTVSITLRYSAISLADFKIAHPGKISDDGTTILNGAFASANLGTNFALPNTVTVIMNNAFRNATISAGFTLPPLVKIIGSGAFWEVSFPSGFILPPSVTTIGGDAFWKTSLPSGFTIPPLVTVINTGTFSGAIFQEGFTLPPTVTSVELGGFSQAHLPAGFSIPSTTKIKMDILYGIPPSFDAVILPVGYEWHDAQGNKIADQTRPTPGCVVAPIAP